MFDEPGAIETIRVSIATDGTQANFNVGAGNIPAISADGRIVAFSTPASNLVPEDTNSATDIYLRDTCKNGPPGCTPTTRLASAANDGSAGNGFSSGFAHSLSSTGRFVAFSSHSTNLVEGDTNNFKDVFVRDTCLAAPPGCSPSTVRVSIAPGGIQGNQASSLGQTPKSALSADARVLVFTSDANNIVPGDTNSFSDLFLAHTGFSELPPSPVPTLGSLSPSSAPAGGNAFTLTLNGAGFVSGSIVGWNGMSRPTTFISANQLTAQIPASDLAVPGSAQVIVFNPAPGGGASNALTFTIPNLTPAITLLVPDSIPVGSSAFTLTVNGSGFQDGSSAVRLNGADRTTTFISNTQLTAQIPDTDIATAGSRQITVFNPLPGGGLSNSQPLTVSLRNPLPTVTGLTPPGAVAGAVGFMLNVNGSNFVFNSEVRWDGAPRATTFLSSNLLQALIPATDLELADIGSHPVTVLNPGPGGGTSNALNFNVLNMPNPLPMLASIDPTEVIAGSVRDTLTLTLTGADFLPSSVVRWNGMNRLTSFVSANQLMATIPASDLVSAGAAFVSVFTPSPAGGTSLPAVFTINNPAPTLNAINPNTAMAGDPAFTLTVLGSNFVPSSVVRWNGADRPTSFIGSNQLRAAISADDLASDGMASVTVFTPGPGGGASDPLAFTITMPSQANAERTTAASPSPQPTAEAPPPAAQSAPRVVIAPAAASSGASLPAIESLRPATIIAGSGTLKLVVRGENFTEKSVVRWKGEDLPTKFLSRTELEVEIPAEALAHPGEVKLTVFAPGPAGAASKPATLTVTDE